MKLVTAAVALRELGPQFRFRTGLFGYQRGDSVETLVIRGEGDPGLRVHHLDRLVRVLEGRGVAKVGKILVDQSRFDGRYVPPAFEQQPKEWASFRAPVSAVALERNAVVVNVLAGRAGEAARVWVHPPGFVSLKGGVKTKKTGSGQGVRLSVRAVGKRLQITLGGHVAEGLPRLRFARRVSDPSLLPGYVLAHALRRVGIKVQGDVAAGGRNISGRLCYHSSPPLSSILPALGKDSDNFAAEMLLKAVGAKSGVGSSEAGASVALALMKGLAPSVSKMVVRNGSGLFDANRVNAGALSSLLVHAASSPRLGPDFVFHLAIGGVDGTLRARFRSERTKRSIRAKTGTLRNAVALSGYVLAPQGRSDVAFSLLINGARAPHSEQRKRIDEVVVAIAKERYLRPSSG